MQCSHGATLRERVRGDRTPAIMSFRRLTSSCGSFARAAAIACAFEAAGCTYDATEVVVVVDTDLAPAPTLALRAYVRSGVTTISAGSSPDHTWNDVRHVDAGNGAIVLPASFAVTPSP